MVSIMAQRACRGNTVHARHVAVEDHQIEILRLDHIEHIFAVIDRDHRVAAAFENLADHLAVGRAVVGHDDAEDRILVALLQVVAQIDDTRRDGTVLLRRNRMQAR